MGEDACGYGSLLSHVFFGFKWLKNIFSKIHEE